MSYWVYILRCADDTLYTGVCVDIGQRLAAHNSGRAAKYTRGRLPAELVYCEACADRSAALRRECAIKRLKRGQKLLLIAAGSRTSAPARPAVCSISKGAKPWTDSAI